QRDRVGAAGGDGRTLARDQRAQERLVLLITAVDDGLRRDLLDVVLNDHFVPVDGKTETAELRGLVDEAEGLGLADLRLDVGRSVRVLRGGVRRGNRVDPEVIERSREPARAVELLTHRCGANVLR